MLEITPEEQSSVSLEFSGTEPHVTSANVETTTLAIEGRLKSVVGSSLSCPSTMICQIRPAGEREKEAARCEQGEKH